MSGTSVVKFNDCKKPETETSTGDASVVTKTIRKWKLLKKPKLDLYERRNPLFKLQDKYSGKKIQVIVGLLIGVCCESDVLTVKKSLQFLFW